jgi:Fur family peroxide stress response transcriptional regulator
MLAALRTRGLRLTPQRAAVVRELATDESHPTAQELFDRLRGSMPTMSFATVYNTLDVLRRSDLCSALALSPGSGRFDPNVLPHDHLVCDRCGLVRDLSPAEAPSKKISPPRQAGRAAQSLRLAAVAPHFRLRAVEQVFRGLCAGCAALPRPAPEPDADSPSPPSPLGTGTRRQARARARSRGRARA